MESLVLPLEFPDGGNGACAAREVGKGVIDWNGVGGLIDTNIELGPFWNLTFDLFIYSMPFMKNIRQQLHPSATLLAYQIKSVKKDTYGDCAICITLDRNTAANKPSSPWGQKPRLSFHSFRIGRAEVPKVISSRLKSVRNSRGKQPFGIGLGGTVEVSNLKMKEWFTVEFSRHQLNKKVMREAVKKEKSFIIITFFNMGGKGGGACQKCSE